MTKIESRFLEAMDRKRRQFWAGARDRLPAYGEVKVLEAGVKELVKILEEMEERDENDGK